MFLQKIVVATTKVNTPKYTTYKMSQIEEFFCEELERWQTAADNYKNLEKIITDRVDCSEYEIRLQFNPARIVSTGAKIDSNSIKERKCFLCETNRVPEQHHIPWCARNSTHNYQICVNPFPIFKRHFTVADAQHLPQLIEGRVTDLLELAFDFNGYTAFYNGPKSGASAPDHAHFQLIPKGEMPIEEDCRNRAIFMGEQHGEIFRAKEYLRTATLFKSGSLERVIELFKKEITEYTPCDGDSEVRMNLIAWYENQTYHLVFMPRTEHRPKEFFLDDPDKIMFSPGAVDMGGLIIAPRSTDFEKYKSAELLKKLYAQVSPTNP